MPAMPAPDADLSPFKFTYEDYCTFPEDGRRHEILDGMHVVSPAPFAPHQEVLGRLHLRMGTFVEQNPVGKLYLAPFDVLLGPHDIVQPDLVFISNQSLEILNRKHAVGVPDLLVEILSSHKARDTVQKRARYQAAGVPEYWLVDPDARTLEVLRLDDEGVYQSAQVFDVESGGLARTPLLPGFELDVERLFQG